MVNMIFGRRWLEVQVAMVAAYTQRKKKQQIYNDTFLPQKLEDYNKKQEDEQSVLEVFGIEVEVFEIWGERNAQDEGKGHNRQKIVGDWGCRPFHKSCRISSICLSTTPRRATTHCCAARPRLVLSFSEESISSRISVNSC